MWQGQRGIVTEGGGSNQVASESLGTHTKQNATLYFATATMRLPQGRRQRGGGGPRSGRGSLCDRGGKHGGRIRAITLAMAMAQNGVAKKMLAALTVQGGGGVAVGRGGNGAGSLCWRRA